MFSKFLKSIALVLAGAVFCVLTSNVFAMSKEAAFVKLEPNGISSDMSYEDAKKIYRRLAFKFHPDRNPAGEETFKVISSAWSALNKDDFGKIASAADDCFSRGRAASAAFRFHLWEDEIDFIDSLATERQVGNESVMRRLTQKILDQQDGHEVIFAKLALASMILNITSDFYSNGASHIAEIMKELIRHGYEKVYDNPIDSVIVHVTKIAERFFRTKGPYSFYGQSIFETLLEAGYGQEGMMEAVDLMVAKQKFCNRPMSRKIIRVHFDTPSGYVSRSLNFLELLLNKEKSAKFYERCCRNLDILIDDATVRTASASAPEFVLVNERIFKLLEKMVAAGYVGAYSVAKKAIMKAVDFERGREINASVFTLLIELLIKEEGFREAGIVMEKFALASSHIKRASCAIECENCLIKKSIKTVKDILEEHRDARKRSFNEDAASA